MAKTEEVPAKRARRVKCKFCHRLISPRTMTKHINAKHKGSEESSPEQYLRTAIRLLYKKMKEHVLSKNFDKAYTTACSIEDLEHAEA